MKSEPGAISINIEQFHHRVVRDLAWCLISKDLLSDTASQTALVDSHILSWLHSIDRKPDPLYEFIETMHSPRLGIYFEYLLKFYFTHHHRFELITHNLQLSRNKQTLGEFDFIVFDNTLNQHWHIEAAVKWYLYRNYCLIDGPQLDSKTAQWCQWIGPNDNDSLSKKMVSLLTKQLTLSKQVEALNYFESIGIKNVSPYLWLKGYLYGHGEDPKHPDNFWFSDSKIPALEQEQFIILPKLFWLSPLYHDDYQSLKIYSKAELAEKVKREGRTSLIAALDQNNKEQYRCFITLR